MSTDPAMQLPWAEPPFSYEGAGHGFFNGSPYYTPTLQRMTAFLVEQLTPGV